MNLYTNVNYTFTTAQDVGKILTEDETILTLFKINNFFITVTNYADENLLVTLYREGNCVCICTFASVHNRLYYNMLHNALNIDEQLLDNTMHKLQKALQEV